MFRRHNLMMCALLAVLSWASQVVFAEDPPLSDPASEADNSPQGATKFSASGKGVENTLSTVTDIDFYKLTLRDPGSLTIELSQKAPRVNNLIGWRVDLYSESDLAHSMTTVLLPETSLAAKTVQGLNKGDYYLKVSSLHPEVPVLTAYNIKAAFEKSDYFEKAPNQMPATATPVLFNQLYQGNTSYAGEVDYYRFSLTADDAVTIKLSQDNPGVNSTLGWMLTLFSAQSLDTPLQVVNMPETMLKSGLPDNLPLPAGVYFLRINSLNPQVASANNYQLTINAASQGNVNVVCAQVIAYAQHPITMRWVAFPTPCDVPPGWFSQLTLPEGVNLQTTGSMKLAAFLAETNVLDIPAVEIPNGTGAMEVYQAQLQLISTQPTYQFELIPSSLLPVK